MIKKRLWLLVGSIGVFFLGFGAIQLIPYGHQQSNPVVIQEPAWNNAQTRALTKRSCFDCHSNETIWPWYSQVAPISWLIQQDVEKGRERLNFSEWNRHENSFIGEAAQYLIQEDIMPPTHYLTLHPEAVLSEEEKQTLLDGLRESLK
jgi:mono/diheme cytochrome c family protein